MTIYRLNSEDNRVNSVVFFIYYQDLLHASRLATFGLDKLDNECCLFPPNSHIRNCCFFEPARREFRAKHGGQPAAIAPP